MRKLYENSHIFHFQKRLVSADTIRGNTVNDIIGACPDRTALVRIKRDKTKLEMTGYESTRLDKTRSNQTRVDETGADRSEQIVPEWKGPDQTGQDLKDLDRTGPNQTGVD